MTSTDSITLSIAEAVAQVLSEGEKHYHLANDHEQEESQGDHLDDYESLSALAEKISTEAERVGAQKLFQKASNLHLDAANESGSSSSDRLFSSRELKHLGDAKYYSLRAEGIDDSQAQVQVSEYVRELSSHERIHVDKV